jgi:DNA invertase Pin-like site-specific DNA recombinase
MLIGYAWVSTDEEAFDLQKEALDRAGVDRLYADVTIAADAKRPQLEQALSQLRQGDTLVVWKLDRLGRSVQHLIETVEELTRRGIGFRSLQESIDTTTSVSKLMFHAFGRAMAEFERDLIQEQTAAGPARTPAPGRRRGRRFKLDEQKQALAVMLYKDPSNSVAALCRRFRIGRTTLYRYVGERE